MQYSKIKFMVIASAMLLVASSVHGATKGRVIPAGSVSFQKNGTVAKYSVQTPLDDNALITCNKSCMVKLQGLSLTVTDQTKFAVKKIDNVMNIYVETGRVNFTLTNTSQQISFYTRGGQYVQTEGFMVPASTAGTVKGYLNMAGDTAAIGMDSGSMVVQTAEGLKTIRSGQEMQIALAEVPENRVKKAAPKKQAPEKKGGWWSSMDGQQMGGIITSGVIVAGATTLIIVENNKDDNNSAASLNQ